MHAKVRCDDVATIYVDGQYVGDTTNSTDVWESDSIPDTTSVIAVRCYNKGDSNGSLITWLSNGFTSGYYWRCSSSEEEDWYTQNYNDSWWERALVLSTDVPTSQFPVPSRWIWSADDTHTQANKTTFCRGDLSTIYFTNYLYLV